MTRALYLLFVCCVCASVPAWSQCPDGTPPPCGPRLAHVAAPLPTSVAVLYFDNLSRDSGDAYLAEGITEEIISRLGDVARLTVKSRYAVRRYRGRAAASEPAALGRTLGVAYLVTGSVQRAGNRLRVRAELARASTGNRTWGQEYDRGDGDVFGIMADIATNVVAGVAGSLLPAERVALGARPTESHEAYDHLLKGDLLLGQRTPVSVRQAIAEYEAAARLDPVLAVAWAKMSVAYGVLVQRGWTTDGRPPDDSLGARSIAAAERALALDSGSSDAWMAQGYARMVRDPLAWLGAEDGFRRAVALNPRNAEAWHQLGDLLGAVGRETEATSAYRAAVAVEPGRPVSMLSLATTLPAREALAACDSVLAVDPSSSNAYIIRALDRLKLGDTAGARADRASLERVIPLGAELGTRALAARLTLAMGDTADARRRARAILSDMPSSGPIHTRIAGLLAGVLYDVGEHDAAYGLLRRAPRGAGTWQSRAGAGWQADPRIQRVFEESRPPWGRP
jgi:TolB-like protein/tetratricopeptide (TPR) repeat protein